jgi:hypothetical protein
MTSLCHSLTANVWKNFNAYSTPGWKPFNAYSPPSLFLFPLRHFGAMSDQQSWQDNELESQQDDKSESQQGDKSESQQDDESEPQQDGQVVLPPHHRALIELAAVIIKITCNIALESVASNCRTPYHTSALSGADWVYELLNGHPQCIWNELGISRSTFIILLKSMQVLDVKSLRHVSIEELSIFLYTIVTGLSCTHVDTPSPLCTCRD